MRRRKSNHKQHGFLVIALAVILLTAGVWHFVQLTRADVTETVTVTATVLGCGDGIIQLGEDCDGANLNSHTCITEGFLSGSISCTPSCTLNTSSCALTPPSSGGATPVVPAFSTTEIFTGYAYPGATVTILKDGQAVATVTADAIGEFYARINNLTNGTYTFGFIATDTAGNNSALSTISLTATGGTVTTPNIFLSPTISPLPTDITGLDEIPVSGQTSPGSLVTVSLFSPSGTILVSQQVTADSSGAYAVSFITSALTDAGTYSITAIAGIHSLVSTVSLPVNFPLDAPAIIYMPGDYNENQRVNLVDFSIALYWYKEQLSDAFKILEIRHGNGDGLLNLIDISIIAYWWTG